MFDNLITRITSPGTRRRHTYHCPEVHSDPEQEDSVTSTPRKPRLLERRRKGRRVPEPGLRQARSLGRLDGLKEVSFVLFFSIVFRSFSFIYSEQLLSIIIYFLEFSLLVFIDFYCFLFDPLVFTDFPHFYRVYLDN